MLDGRWIDRSLDTRWTTPARSRTAATAHRCMARRCCQGQDGRACAELGQAPIFGSAKGADIARVAIGAPWVRICAAAWMSSGSAGAVSASTVQHWRWSLIQITKRYASAWATMSRLPRPQCAPALTMGVAAHVFHTCRARQHGPSKAGTRSRQRSKSSIRYRHQPQSPPDGGCRDGLPRCAIACQAFRRAALLHTWSSSKQGLPCGSRQIPIRSYAGGHHR